MLPDPNVLSLAKWVLRLVTTFVKERPSLVEQVKPNQEEVIARHLTEALEWASRLQLFGMSAPLDPASSTVALRLSDTPRRFRGVANPVEQREDYLLESPNSILLLGPLGSGKTTTLKRLTRQLIVGELPEEIGVLLPFVIRVRELERDESLTQRIASMLGFSTTAHDSAKEVSIGRGRAKDVIAEFLRGNRVALAVR